MASDNIELLTYSANINSLATVYTPKVILSQYISVAIIGAASETISIVLQFSGDGSNWDYSVTRQLQVGDNTVLTNPVVGKWMRLAITNQGLIATTYLRLFVYGSPSNSSISANINKIGNLNPTVDVGNLPLTSFGELMTAEDRPQIQYVFCKGTTGLMQSQTWKLPYDDIYTWCDDDLVYVTIDNGVIHFGYDMLINNRAILAGSTYPYKAGQGIESKFTGYFVQAPHATAVPSTEYIGIGNYDSSTNRPRDFYGFGYVPTSTEFGIVYINNGTRTFYPQSAWTVDPCNGTYIMPSIDFSKMNVFEVSFQYLGFGMVRFYVENPSTGLPQLVHTINRVNSVIQPTNLANPSLGLIMFIECDNAIPTPLTNDIGVGSFTYTIQGNPIKPNERVSVSASKTPISAETPILSIRCNDTWYSGQNYYPIDVDFLSCSVDGTKNAIIKLYKNCTLAGTAFTNPLQDVIPVARDSTGTISLYGTELMAFTLDKGGKQLVYLDELHMHLGPGDILTITCQSAANTDVTITASCHIH